MKRLLFGVLAMCSQVPAQAGWTAEEAGAVAFHTAQKMDHEASLMLRRNQRGPLPEFVPTIVARSMCLTQLRERFCDGKTYRFETSRVTVPNQELCLLTYLLPLPPSQRAFVSDMQGRILFTERDGRKFEASDAAMPRDDAAANGLTSKSTTGRDGRTWRTLSAAPMATKAVAVIDEHGKPFDEVLLTIGPASWFAPDDERLRIPVGEFALPASMAASTKGRATLRGIVTDNLYLGVCHPVAIAQRQSCLLPGVKVSRRDGQIVVTVPRAPLRSMRCTLNERSAHTSLQMLSSGQSQCMVSAVIDVDGDDVGEFGYLAELAGVTATRSAAPAGEGRLHPSVLSKRYGELTHGCLTHTGYLLQVFLPGKSGWLAEGTATTKSVAPDLAEQFWRCYAWPLKAGETGQRAFFVDQTGTVYCSDNHDGRYSGFDNRPAADAAVGTKGFDTLVAANGQGVDGQIWQPFVR